MHARRQTNCRSSEFSPAARANVGRRLNLEKVRRKSLHAKRCRREAPPQPARITVTPTTAAIRPDMSITPPAERRAGLGPELLQDQRQRAEAGERGSIGMTPPAQFND